ncbi:putative beta-secretase 2 [Scophthalmus maximus]|uniref:Putative beta-secretase 2 n=1 Tax=Scophthalmus maximus TaxID=52904 RepID=A0A2U9B6P8_SCOMX|nr:putative beta-secretase 2 [Scophthalmus maximus]
MTSMTSSTSCASLPCRALLLLLWLGASRGLVSIPLRLHAGRRVDVSGAAPLRRVALLSEPGGLALASDPTGAVDFLDMTDNLQGDSGRGYYLEMSIGTPGQTVLIYT